MEPYSVLEWPHSILETRADEISVFDEELITIAERMFITMEKKRGVGLAANQIGLLKRIFVVHIPYLTEDLEDGIEKKWWHDQKLVFINPKILKASKEEINWYEGCLSFPEAYDYVKRPKFVTVEYADLTGVRKTIEADELFCVCLQHELDHLDGIVFFKKMSRLKASNIKKKMLQRQQRSME